MHADCEAVLLEDGSHQEFVWGADWNPETQELTFESLINIRPRQNNRSLELQDPGNSSKSGTNHQRLAGWHMKDWTTIRERFLRDDISVRLGGLAANLSRIKSFANNENNKALVESLIDESKHFIEWTAHETEIEIAAKLVELQVGTCVMADKIR